MNTILPADPEKNRSSLKIRGRIMSYEAFAERLQNFCLALGFSSGKWDGMAEPCGCMPEFSWRWTEGEEAVIVLSCPVPYNPNWGGFSGHPQLLLQTEENEQEQSPAAFIAPYLRQYRFAREDILLAANERGEHHIIVPARFLEKAADRRQQLLVDLKKVARPGQDGRIVPVVDGPLRSYALSAAFLRDLQDRNFAWKVGRKIPVGRFLDSELFTFADAEDAPETDSLFGTTLLPHIREIVAHPTPNLRAAEIHLGRIFSQTVATLTAEYHRHNILCIAGLRIDMSGFIGHKGHCFVPWQTYLGRRGKALFLGQDDLFVRLKMSSC